MSAVPAMSPATRAWGGFMHRALRHPSFVIGSALTLLLVAAAALSLVWTPWSTYEMNLAGKVQPPSAAHWLGTDPFGRESLEVELDRPEASIRLRILPLTEGDADAGELRRRVTSPGGTTQAAIEAFQAGGFESLVARAVHAARERGAALAAAGDA